MIQPYLVPILALSATSLNALTLWLCFPCFPYTPPLAIGILLNSVLIVVCAGYSLYRWQPIRYWHQIGQHTQMLLPLWIAHIDLAKGQINQAAHALIECFKALQKPGSYSTHTLRYSTEAIPIHLQFQDWVNQMLSSVQDDICKMENLPNQELQEHIGIIPSPDTQTWLEQLKTRYTTYEQRTLHEPPHTSLPSEQEDVTFFREHNTLWA